MFGGQRYGGMLHDQHALQRGFAMRTACLGGAGRPQDLPDV